MNASQLIIQLRDPGCLLKLGTWVVFLLSPYGPFVPAPPEMAMQMMQKGHSGPDAARHGKPSVLGPTLPMYPSFPLGRRTYRRSVVPSNPLCVTSLWHLVLLWWWEWQPIFTHQLFLGLVRLLQCIHIHFNDIHFSTTCNLLLALAAVTKISTLRRKKSPLLTREDCRDLLPFFFIELITIASSSRWQVYQVSIAYVKSRLRSVTEALAGWKVTEARSQIWCVNMFYRLLHVIRPLWF